MKCVICDSKMILEKDKIFHYTQCGLKNIYLKGVTIYHCSNKECSDTVFTFPHLSKLHQFIAERLASQKNSLLPEEIRYLRTHLGFSGIDFSKIMGVSAETVTRWEKGNVNMKQAAEKLLRVLILSNLGPFRNYEGLKTFSTVENKSQPQILLKLVSTHWTEVKAA